MITIQFIIEHLNMIISYVWSRKQAFDAERMEKIQLEKELKQQNQLYLDAYEKAQDLCLQLIKLKSEYNQNRTHPKKSLKKKEA